MSIKTKLKLIITAPLLGLLLITGIMSVSYRDIERENVQKDRIYSVFQDIFQFHLLNDDLLYGNDSRARFQWDARYANLLSTLTSMGDFSNQEQRVIVKRVRAALEESNQLISQGLDKYPDNLDVEYRNLLKNQIDIKLDYMLSDTAKLLAISRGKTEEILARTGYITLTIILLVVFFIGINALMVKHSMVAPYNNLVEGLKNISQGRFDLRLPVKGSDEISQLKRAVNDMVEKLETSSAVLKDEILRHRATAEALAQSEIKLKALIESTSDWIWEVDSQGIYTYSSSQTIDMLGFAPDEVIGKKIYDFMAPEEVFFGVSGFNSFLENKQPFNGWVMPLKRKDGAMVFVESNGVPIINQGGEIKGFRGVNRNITKRYMLIAEKERLITELQSALDKLKMLSGMLPICSSCKKIRDDSGYWQQIESYITEHSEAEFSHSLCPECAQRLYPDYYKQAVKDKQGTERLTDL